VGRGTMLLDAPAAVTPEATAGPTDLVLVAAVRRGDDRAFEQLYSRYQRRISAYVFGMVKDHGRAEDITQEVFISALRRMRETDRTITFKPWIYEIAKNACIDQFRRSRRAEEVSMDAGEGLGQADHGRLVAGEPTPDAAVDTKQQLDHLCGAFGGLSDSHHEILVLREFEGLSYREIGDRMGLSRPGVESTLFRARKRLTEEYHELVSGQRCARIQSIIVAAEGSALGARDTRRLARHISHCQPCRRQAVASGLDAAVLARKPLRRAAERAAAFLPLPGFLRARMWAGSEQMVPVSEPMAAAWSKAVAVGATIVVAGVGAGVAPHVSGGSTPDLKPDRAKPASSSTRSSSASPAPARALGVSPKRAALRSRSRTGGRHSASLRSSRRTSQPRGGSAPRNAPAQNRPATAPSKAAATKPTRSTPRPSQRGGQSTPAAPSAPPLPQLPDVQVGGQAVENAVRDVGATVNQTAGAGGETVKGVTGGLPTP
jgi:RNA polymerase sigma factor (sigma-70 family)